MAETESLNNVHIEQNDNQTRSTHQIVSQQRLTQVTSPPSYHLLTHLSVNLPVDNYNSTTTSGTTVPAIPAPTVRNYLSTMAGTNPGDLPTYEEALNPDAFPPPSYDSLFGRVREARKTSTGIFDFIKNIIILLLGTIGCTIILGVTIVIPICMMLIGSLYLYDCPQGEYIPVYLLVGGGFGILKQLLNLSTRVRVNREEQDAERLRQTATQSLINCFMLGWFFIGSYWIYKEYEPNYDPTKGKYCNKTLYLFSFYLVTSVYASLVIVIFCLCAITFASLLLITN